MEMEMSIKPDACYILVFICSNRMQFGTDHMFFIHQLLNSPYVLVA